MYAETFAPAHTYAVTDTQIYIHAHTTHANRRRRVLIEGSFECQITLTWGDKGANRGETSLRMLFYRHASTWKLGAVVTGPVVLCIE